MRGSYCGSFVELLVGLTDQMSVEDGGTPEGREEANVFLFDTLELMESHQRQHHHI